MQEGEKEIDVNQINRERSMSTVDEEEHAVLDALTNDYRQKLQGKPQSHEMVRAHTHIHTSGHTYGRTYIHTSLIFLKRV